ncbi:ABC transporter ATP-binding protein [Murimonas intestini]|uniref:Peptide/nickel transport system ATP-binding protein n=1 Tax=Murimonas intestini TaxID=1337051 RepID=A0AB73T194_9FIRM|nr:ABC transporter ATP-binding protein [Murimonas intestini]MCR1840117.1 ABC transporter ATP-binding protein [Murimonas intestini]MCR1867569.1 ABC transporter ATP-binding protein [Murimonas intestini]MCR1885016.1 ABC transporter ATP-binding protein [Murimonas intestini]
MAENSKLLEVKNLTVHYETDEGIVEAVNDISFHIAPGEILGVVGETGAGKTTIARSIMGLLPKPPAHVISGSIQIEGQEMLSDKPESKGFFDFAQKRARSADERRLERIYREIRGKKISMMFQDPMTALNPVLYVGDQIAEVIKIHENVSEAQARERAGEMLELVGIPADRYKEYPHQFSGGMKQRVVIAIALACHPNLIIADEPTTALDVTIQAQILEMLRDLQKKFGTAIMLITHDFGVVAEICDRCMVIYAGEKVEEGTLEDIFDNRVHPYTVGLFDSMPDMYDNSLRLKPIKGLMPNPMDLPSYCSFYDRCSVRCDACKDGAPVLREINRGHFAACSAAAGRGEVE